MFRQFISDIGALLMPPPFDPEQHRLPLPREHRQPTPTKKIDDAVFYDKAFNSYVRKTTDTPTNSTAWEVVKTTEQADTNRQRVAEVTDNDRQQLAMYADKYPNLNLTIEKLLIVLQVFLLKML